MEGTQIILFVFAAVLLIASAIFAFRKQTSVFVSTLIGALFLIAFAAMGPESVDKVTIGKDEVSMERHRPTPAEQKTSLDAAADKSHLDPKKIQERTQEAKSRNEQQRSDDDYLVLATEAWRNKDYPLALQYAYSGLASPASSKKITASLHNRIGSIFRSKKSYELAIEYYKIAIVLDPNRPDPHNGLGNVYLDQSLYDEAIIKFKEAIRLDPEHPYPHRNLGSAYLKQDRHDDAIGELTEAIRLDPEYVNAYIELGNVYLKLGRYDQAIDANKEAMRLDPKHHLPHNNLGVVYIKQRKYAEAIDALIEAISLNSEYSDSYRNLSLACNELSDQKKKEECLDLLKKLKDK